MTAGKCKIKLVIYFSAGHAFWRRAEARERARGELLMGVLINSNAGCWCMQVVWNNLLSLVLRRGEVRC